MGKTSVLVLKIGSQELPSKGWLRWQKLQAEAGSPVQMAEIAGRKAVQRLVVQCRLVHDITICERDTSAEMAAMF